MNATVLALIFLFRVVIPLGILFTLGEWIKRYEAQYWLLM